MPDLDLWLYGTPVASVTAERSTRARLSFRREAIDRWGLGSRILTVAEPLTTETLPPARTAVVLEGLLPEGEARERLEELFGRSLTDLLASLGRETVGAIVAVPGGDDLNRHAGPALGSELSEVDIAERLRGLRARPLGVSPETSVRISLAGAQPKLPLHRTGAGYFDPSFENPSTVILKPEQGEWPRLVELEAWGLEVMRAAGVAVPDWELASFDGIMTLIVRRFDRYREDGMVSRIHQEDLCMAVGARPREKYATSPRARTSLAALANVVYRNSRRPDEDLDRFIRVVVTNIAIGNCDGHARNLGLLHYEDGTVELAPAYDVVPTYHYSAHSKILAQVINGQRMRPETVTWDHLLAEVRTWGIRGADDHLRDAVAAVFDAVRAVGPPSHSPNLEQLILRADRILP